MKKNQDQQRDINRFRAFYSEARMPIMILDRQGTIKEVNEGWLKINGLKREACIGKNIFEDPGMRGAQLQQAYRQVLEGETVDLKPFQYLQGLWLAGWLLPIKDEDGFTLELGLFLKDVSDRMKNHLALEASINEQNLSKQKIQMMGDRMGLALKAGQVGTWEAFTDQEQVSWDETLLEIHGLKKGEFQPTRENSWEFIHPEDRPRVEKVIQASIQQQGPLDIDYRIIRKDGVVRWVKLNGLTFYDQENRPVSMTGTVIDITNRVEAELDQQFLSTLSENIFSEIDLGNTLNTICRQATDYFCDGILIDQFYAEEKEQHVINFFHRRPEIALRVKAFSELLAAREQSSQSMNYFAMEESLVVEDVKAFIDRRRLDDHEMLKQIQGLELKSFIKLRLKEKNNHIRNIYFLFDQNSLQKVGQRHRWLAEQLSGKIVLAYNNALMHQKSREAIASRDEFISMASHELKTPLQGLMLQGQLRKKNLERGMVENFTEQKLKAMVDSDLKQLHRINRLISDMLDITRIRQGNFQLLTSQVEFCSFLQDVVERFRPQIDAAGCFLQLSICQEVWIEIDVYRIEQLVVNLLTNAIKYGSGKPIKMDVKVLANELHLSVHDEGAGIKPEDFERIFERFERATSPMHISGLGLGLYISRIIASQHQGQLVLQSTLGKGSTFTLVLPLKGRS